MVSSQTAKYRLRIRIKESAKGAEKFLTAKRTYTRHGEGDTPRNGGMDGVVRTNDGRIHIQVHVLLVMQRLNHCSR